MKRLNKIRYRMDIQVFIMTGIIVTVSCTVIFAICYNLTYNATLDQLKSRANGIYNYMESELDVNSFYELERREDESSELYLSSKQMLESTRASMSVRYLYTAKQRADGTFVYLVDGLPTDSYDFRHVGDAIEEECIPFLSKALEDNIILPDDITKTSWGEVFITYFPIHDNGVPIGVLGIEFDASAEYGIYMTLIMIVPVIIAAFCLLSAIAAVFLFRRISNPGYKDMANTDILTGIKNRNAFEVDINNMAQLRIQNYVAVISVDIDGLKMVNDTYGHDMGDEYIKVGVDILIEALEDRGQLYRIGGDEFAMVIPNALPNQLQDICDEIQKEHESSFQFEVRLSAGCAIYDAKTDKTLTDTFKRADKEMYEHKRQRKEKADI